MAVESTPRGAQPDSGRVGAAHHRPTGVLRRPARVIAQTVVLAAFAGVSVAALATARGPGEQAVAVVLAAACAVLAVRSARARVVVSPEGVTVRSTFRTRRIPWSDVTGLDVAVDDWGVGSANLVLRDGRTVRLVPLNGIGWWDGNSQAFDQICNRMGELVDAYVARSDRPGAR